MSTEWVAAVVTAFFSALGAMVAAYFSYRADRQKSMLQHKVEEWRVLLDTAAANIQQLRDRVRYLEEQYDSLSRVLNDERRDWAEERTRLVSEYEGRLVELHRDLEEARRDLIREIETYRERYNNVIAENALLNAKYQQLLVQYETLEQTMQRLRQENDSLRASLHKRRKTDVIDDGDT